VAISFFKEIRTRGMTVTLQTDGLREVEKMITKLDVKMSKPVSIIFLWRKLVLKTLRRRFEREMGPDGPWKKLSRASTIPLRMGPGHLTRIKPPRGGGLPLRILRSSLGEYYRAWTAGGANVPHRQEKVSYSKPESFWMIANDHIATINEFNRRAAGIFKDAKVPKRSVAYIKEDEVLIDELVEIFGREVMRTILT
jgi:hypothetical protein